MSVLRVEHLTYSYPGADRPAVSDVSLAIEPGEFCVLAGMSGSGKSTILRAAAGLVPHFHGGSFAGTVTVAGMDTREHGPAELGLAAGTLLQDPETQVVMTSVRAEIALALENRGQSPGGIARAVEETALALGVAHLLDRATAELSGGELQRVALAAALAPRPMLVLLDEPTSQLDPVAGDELIWQLRRLNQESDTAVLLIEHRLERCLAAADRVIALSDGAVACDSDPAGFLRWAAESQPALATPAARMFAAAGLPGAPTGVKQARAALRRCGLAAAEREPAGGEEAASRRSERRPGRLFPRRAAAQPALRLRGIWHEIMGGPAILRGIDLSVDPGELVVVMGRNGAGKSTLLRHAAGLLEPTRGSVESRGRVALLLQNPGDYFLHERADQEAPASALAAVGLEGLADRHPRDLSGGQRQRLALAIVLGGEMPVAAIALDEPTRGMDMASKRELARSLRERASTGPAVVLATHDVEFAAELADRAVLLADGRVIADGPTSEILVGGRYFTTETARILGPGAGALLPEQGARLVRERMGSAEAQRTVTAADRMFS